ncbi:MAG TPA: aldo/keto reductase [Balneolales bacterium]|nr:aldo/keto reductase [Balneolales bacterium]
MQTRILGKQGPVVSVVGLGCMGMSEFYGSTNDSESIKVIHEAIDRGVTFFDTADMYGVGHNEQLVGKAIKDRRDKVVLATKFGIVRGDDHSFRGVNGHPDYVRKACEASLKRLDVDHIDLYYQHRVDTNVPIEDTIGAMAELVKEGKVKYIGMSEAAPKTLKKASKVHQITALQTEYSLWSRDPEDEIIPTCRELGIGFVAYSPLGRGFLTGRYQSPDDFEDDDFRKYNPRFQGENFTKNLQLVDKINELAKKKNCNPAQLAIAWLLHQGQDIVPIPGTKHMRYLHQNIEAADLTFTKEELVEIDRIAPQGAAAGTRYPEDRMSTVNN